MNLCIYVSMYLCIYASMHLCIYIYSIYLFIKSMYLCIYVSMYLGIYLTIYLFIYIGITGIHFKQRYLQHKSSFKLEYKENETTISQHLWSLERSAKNYEVTWKIICRAPTFSSVTNTCELCTNEKYFYCTNQNWGL